jgi:hypothetical protein
MLLTWPSVLVQERRWHRCSLGTASGKVCSPFLRLEVHSCALRTVPSDCAQVSLSVALTLARDAVRSFVTWKECYRWHCRELLDASNPERLAGLQRGHLPSLFSLFALCQQVSTIHPPSLSPHPLNQCVHVITWCRRSGW